VIPHTFGESAPWSVGIEEELFVLDAETLDPAPFPREGSSLRGSSRSSSRASSR
jgi:hypothetical protein